MQFMQMTMDSIFSTCDLFKVAVYKCVLSTLPAVDALLISWGENAHLHPLNQKKALS